MEVAEVMEQMKKKLLIALARRAGHTVIIPASELNATHDFELKLTPTDNNCLHIEVRKKQ